MTQTASHWWRPTAALDATRIGGQQYTQREVREVLDSLRGTDRNAPVNIASIALGTGVPGRTVRQIISDMDGRVMLVGKTQDGLFVCHYADEGFSYTSALRRHWRSERARERNREAFSTDLPRMQHTLFAPEDLAALNEDLDEDEDETSDYPTGHRAAAHGR